MATPQQEPGQREEHRDGEIEPAEQPARDPTCVSGLKRDMGDDDPDGGARAHALDGGQESPSPADVRGMGHPDQCAVLIDRRENG
jgi:hypothetical protein